MTTHEPIAPLTLQSPGWRGMATWLGVAAAVLLLGESAAWMLARQDAQGAGAAVAWTFRGLAQLWLVGGLMRFAQPRFLLWTAMFEGLWALGGLLLWLCHRYMSLAVGDRVGLTLYVLILGVMVGLVFRAYRTRPGWRLRAVQFTAVGLVASLVGLCWAMDYRRAALAIGGVAAMETGFVVGLWAIRQVLFRGSAVVGVARNVIDEAIRMKIALVFIIGLILLLPVMPFVLSADERLSYRIQFFLGWSLGGMGLLLSLMTIFLACGTICFDLQHKHVFMTLVKPISRLQYLVGKWLGIALLNVLLVTISTGTVYVLVRIMQEMPAKDAADRIAVDEQVLAARVPVEAAPPAEMRFDEKLEELVRAERLAVERGELPAANALTAQALHNRLRLQWHTMEPGGTESFIFTGLDKAAVYGRVVQLRFKPRYNLETDDREVSFMMWINGHPYHLKAGQPGVTLAHQVVHELNVPVDWIENGEMRIRVTHVNPIDPRATHTSSMAFAPEEGVQVLYKVDRFETNLVRAAAIVWLQLAFLAAAGLAAGSFLTFPVAVLGSFLIYWAAAFSEGLKEALQSFAGHTPVEGGGLGQQLITSLWDLTQQLGGGRFGDAAKVALRMVGDTFVSLVPSFQRYSGVPLVRDGYYISYAHLGSAALVIGLVGTLLAGLTAWAIFRRRELARVIV